MGGVEDDIDNDEDSLFYDFMLSTVCFSGGSAVAAIVGTLLQKVLSEQEAPLISNAAHAALGGATLGILHYASYAFFNMQNVNYKFVLLLMCSSLLVGNMLDSNMVEGEDFTWQNSLQTEALGTGVSVMAMF